ncbi:MAG: M23 family metallopeptidase [Candidatus Sericytochromatia bacterium]
MTRILLILTIFLLDTNYSNAENEIKEVDKDRPAISYKITPKLNLYSDKVYQGRQIVVSIIQNDIENAYLEFNNKKYKVLSKKVFIPIHPETKEGTYTIKLLNNEKIESEINLKVLKNYFSSQKITYYKPKLSKEEEEKIKREEALVEDAKQIITDKQLWDSPFILPVPHRVSSLYGIKRYLNGKRNGYHGGVDFASPFGYPIKAINNANVTLAKYFSKYNSNGNIVFLNHGLGVSSAYLHLNKIVVKEGDYVKKGQTIGYIGSSGRSTGPHLHWSVYLYGQNTDGLAWTNLTKSIK